jgi:hypothetical protein
MKRSLKPMSGAYKKSQEDEDKVINAEEEGRVAFWKAMTSKKAVLFWVR